MKIHPAIAAAFGIDTKNVTALDMLGLSESESAQGVALESAKLVLGDDDAPEGMWETADGDYVVTSDRQAILIGGDGSMKIEDMPAADESDYDLDENMDALLAATKKKDAGPLVKFLDNLVRMKLLDKKKADSFKNGMMAKDSGAFKRLAAMLKRLDALTVESVEAALTEDMRRDFLADVVTGQMVKRNVKRDGFMVKEEKGVLKVGPFVNATKQLKRGGWENVDGKIYAHEDSDFTAKVQGAYILFSDDMTFESALTIEGVEAALIDATSGRIPADVDAEFAEAVSTDVIENVLEVAAEIAEQLGVTEAYDKKIAALKQPKAPADTGPGKRSGGNVTESVDDLDEKALEGAAKLNCQKLIAHLKKSGDKEAVALAEKLMQNLKAGYKNESDDLDEVAKGDDVVYDGKMAVVLDVKGDKATIQCPGKPKKTVPVSKLTKADTYDEGDDPDMHISMTNAGVLTLERDMDEVEDPADSVDLTDDDDLDEEAAALYAEIIDAVALFSEDDMLDLTDPDDVVRVVENFRKQTPADKKKAKIAAKRRARGIFKVSKSQRTKMARSAARLAKSAKGKALAKKRGRFNKQHSSTDTPPANVVEFSVPKTDMPKFLTVAEQHELPDDLDIVARGDQIVISLPEAKADSVREAMSA